MSEPQAGRFQRANGLPGGSVVAVPTAPLTPYASRGLLVRFPTKNLQAIRRGSFLCGDCSSSGLRGRAVSLGAERLNDRPLAHIPNPRGCCRTGKRPRPVGETETFPEDLNAQGVLTHAIACSLVLAPLIFRDLPFVAVEADLRWALGDHQQRGEGGMAATNIEAPTG